MDLIQQENDSAEVEMKITKMDILFYITSFCAGFILSKKEVCIELIIACIMFAFMGAHIGYKLALIKNKQ